jgi:hypothetical protein
MVSPFEAGKIAQLSGKTQNDNPYLTGEFTKLGNPKMTEEGHEWINGFNSVIVRKCSKEEILAADKVDISRFKRKSNRYYGR